MHTKKVMVAMSGGVDSSVAAYLIKQQALETIGATLKLFNNVDVAVDTAKTCCSLRDVEDARAVATRLDIPYYVLNFVDYFKKDVIYNSEPKTINDGLTDYFNLFGIDDKTNQNRKRRST